MLPEVNYDSIPFLYLVKVVSCISKNSKRTEINNGFTIGGGNKLLNG